MGKWAARLAEKTAARSYGCTDETVKREVLSVLAVTPEGGARVFDLRPQLQDRPPTSPAAPDLAAVSWTDTDISAFLRRRAQLLRWGWAEPDAEKLAERLVKRDREHDERVNCTDCRHYRPGRCGNHRRAGLNVADVGRDFASLLQRCFGYEAIAGKQRKNTP